VPFVNWSLFVAVCVLVLVQNSSSLASAWHRGGTTMVISTSRWWWRASSGNGRCGGGARHRQHGGRAFFLASNAVKFTAGGWVPVLIGTAIFRMLMTWKRGRALMFGASPSRASRSSLPRGLGRIRR
jgi:KUP system potassium uptake protein